MSNSQTVIDKFATMGLSIGKGYLNEISSFPILAEQEEQELAVEYKKTDSRRAACILMCTHLR